MYKIVTLLLILSCTSCVVLPEKDYTQKYQCALSTEMKVLKLVNLTDGDTSFYEWNDEMLAIISIPTSAIISASYVLVNNIYYIGEKKIKCDKSKANKVVKQGGISPPTLTDTKI